ncbi:ABC transporter ATP-binding protein [Salinisphaera sp. LB1]|uniref:ABC transporter ATP-binding protein n=1 Tax=Salinisphaera sp. LB1 TaxID=2183911 RepID=UPI000D705601|nr:ABC transporter ATP-binding protein [Salinisphaera sp. LB1]AWN15114.1 Putrescine transport ATP-binding protein PotA [Salinisphaera sp. LB1]
MNDFAPAAAVAAEDAIVRLAGVGKTFGATVAVETLDLDIRRGEFFTLLGPSGSGKTTTLRMIAGFERPSAGTIDIDGRDVTKTAPYDRDINTIFQDYALFPHMSVAKNVAYGLQAKRVGRRDIPQRVAEALRAVRLENYGARNPAQLSGGQRQRVALARAIVNRPRVLLLDEPLGALDLKLRQEMQHELKRIQAEVAITFIYVTHDQEEALTMSDRIAVFNEGRIEQIGDPVTLYERPASEFVANFVGTSNFVERGGARFVLRPEKIRFALHAEAFAADGWQVEPGRIEFKEFVGMFARYTVALDAGERVVVTEQNLPGHSVFDRVAAGDAVHVAWHRDSLYALPGNV